MTNQTNSIEERILDGLAAAGEATIDRLVSLVSERLDRGERIPAADVSEAAASLAERGCILRIGFRRYRAA